MSIITHSVNFEVSESWGRFNTLAWQYYDIAEAAYDIFLEAQESYVPLPGNDEDPTEHFTSQRNLLSASFKTIVFSGMACEAAIYDLAAIQLGDDYAAQYLDKLDPISKWVIIPSLICGKSLNEKGPAINSLRTLVRTRNALVHHKSLPSFPFDEAVRKADGQLGKFIDNTPTAYKAIILLSLELNKVLGTQSGVLPFFEKTAEKSPRRIRSPRIEKALTRCREIHANQNP